jgi:hypothetical protein
MAGTNAVVAKRALVALMQAAPGLEGVQVTYGFPKEPLREFVYCGRASSTVSPLRFRANGARLPRDEELTVDLIVTVIAPGGTTEDAEARAVEIGTVVEEAIALDTQLSQMPGLMIALVTGGTLDGDFDDEEAGARLIYQVHFRSELT